MSYLRLRVRELLKESDTNLHRAMQKGGFSYPTMHRYMAYPDQVESLHTPTVLALLMGALDYTADEIEAMPTGHFFEVMADGDRPATNWLSLYQRLAESYLIHVEEIGDPILVDLAQTQLARLNWMLEHDGDPIDETERRRYLIQLLEERMRAWAQIGAANLGPDEEMANLTQLSLARLEELRRQTEEDE